MYYHDVGWMGGLWMLLFLVGIIVLAVWAVQAVGRGQHRPAERNRAKEILEERFARGEIDQQEFTARRRELERE